MSMKTIGRVVLLLELIVGDGGKRFWAVVSMVSASRVNLKWLNILDLVP